jgi:hypothetical protein
VGRTGPRAVKILDERPLTKDFADTPLAGLRNALMAL